MTARPAGRPRSGARQTLRASLALLTTRRFGTFWFASLLSSVGTWAQQVAEPWLLLTLGASSFLIGLDAFAMNAPGWLLTLPGGALADRADRRRVIAVFQSIQMLCPAAIVALLLAGALRPWMVIALSVVVGVTDALSMPSFQSIVPSIVPREQIGTGLALNSTQFNLSRVLGPSLAGLLMSSVGALACFAVSTLSYVPFIGVALWILPRWTRPAPPPDAAAPRETIPGIGDVFRQPVPRDALLGVFSTALLCTPLVTFCPVLVRDGFHGDAGHFSVSVAAFGAGGLLGGLALLAMPAHIDRRRLCSGSAIAHAVVVALAAVAPWFWALPALLVLAGASMTVSNTAANTLLQSTADPRVLGRTVGLYQLAMRGGMSLGALVTGAAVGGLGVRRALLLNGLLALAAQSALAWSWLRARREVPS
jgi:MFS family permease